MRDAHAAAFVFERELEEAEEISTTEVRELTLRLTELELSYRETKKPFATTAAMLCSELQAKARDFRNRLVALKKIIESLSALTSLPHTHKGSDSADHLTSTGRRVRLPNIELPHFNGDILDWQNFGKDFSQPSVMIQTSQPLKRQFFCLQLSKLKMLSRRFPMLLAQGIMMPWLRL